MTIKLVVEKPAENIISVEDAVTEWRMGNNKPIVAYVTPNKKYMAILYGAEDNSGFGFQYLGTMILEPWNCRAPDQLKFFADTVTESIQAAMDARRKVYLFETWTELLRFAAGLTKAKTG